MNSNRLVLTSIVFFLFSITSGQTGDAIKTTGNDYEFFSGNEEFIKAVDRIAKLVNENKVSVSRLGSDGLYHAWGSEKNIRVLKDRIEISKNGEIINEYYYDIIKKISYTSAGKKIIGINIGDFRLNISGKGYNEQLRDELYFIWEQHMKFVNEQLVKKIEDQKSDLILFEQVAASYRALKVKPPISEEQRRYVVQANSYNQKKEFIKAIELYQKAIEIDQTAYPAAYSNMALLSAQVGAFNDAIFYMKKYIMLEPEAPDSRGARDKIYEWEAELAKD